MMPWWLEALKGVQREYQLISRLLVWLQLSNMKKRGFVGSRSGIKKWVSARRKLKSQIYFNLGPVARLGN